MPRKSRSLSADPGFFGPSGASGTGPPEAAAPPTLRDPLELGAEAAGRLSLRPVTVKAGARRQLPYSKQFTPAQVPSLGGFLGAVRDHSGNRDDVQLAVFHLLSPGQTTYAGPKRTMAYNALLSARDYCLVTPQLDALTDFGAAMLALSDDESRLRLLAQHILRNLNGIELVTSVSYLAKAHMRLTKEPLAEHLARGGLGSNPDGTDINGVRQWLAAVGVFRRTGWYEVDEQVFERLADVSIETVTRAAALDAVGQAILEQLALFPNLEATSEQMVKLLRSRRDLHFAPTSFVRNQLEPLQDAGFIALEKTTGGRGGSGHRFRGTTTFATAAVQQLLAQIRAAGFAVTGPELQVPFAELIPQLRDTRLSSTQRGRALELFALRLLMRMGLHNIRPPERPRGNEEIDGYAEAFEPVHTRWQVQCKNMATFTVDHAAREVGVAVRNRSTAILMVTTGAFSRDAEAFVDDVVRYSAYTVVRLNGRDVDRLTRDETAIFEILDREAHRAKSLREGAVPLPQATGADSSEAETSGARRLNDARDSEPAR